MKPVNEMTKEEIDELRRQLLGDSKSDPEETVGQDDEVVITGTFEGSLIERVKSARGSGLSFDEIRSLVLDSIQVSEVNE